MLEDMTSCWFYELIHDLKPFLLIHIGILLNKSKYVEVVGKCIYPKKQILADKLIILIDRRLMKIETTFQFSECCHQVLNN